MGLENVTHDGEIEFSDWDDLSPDAISLMRAGLSKKEIKDILYSNYGHQVVKAGLALGYDRDYIEIPEGIDRNRELLGLYHNSKSRKVRIAAGKNLGYWWPRRTMNELLYNISSWIERKYDSFLRIKF